MCLSGRALGSVRPKVLVKNTIIRRVFRPTYPALSYPVFIPSVWAIGAGLGQLDLMVYKDGTWHLRLGVPPVLSCPVPIPLCASKFGQVVIGTGLQQ